jgi:transcriptional regulator with XRE-family HTH domain
MAAPHPYDVLVGANIRLYRIAANVSQTDLGEQLGVTFQQIQKYEKGTNRVGAGRLFVIATVLKVPVVRFYDGLKTPSNTRAPIQLLGRRDAFRLAAAFDKITNPRLRHTLVALVQSLSES